MDKRNECSAMGGEGSDKKEMTVNKAKQSEKEVKPEKVEATSHTETGPRLYDVARGLDGNLVTYSVVEDGKSEDEVMKELKDYLWKLHPNDRGDAWNRLVVQRLSRYYKYE